jgi:TRAP-type transport system small permease protein
VHQLTPTTQISMAWIYAAIPVGAALLLLHWALVVRRYVMVREFPADPHFDANASASL